MAEGVANLVAPIRSARGLHYKNPRFPLNIKLSDNLECGSKIFIHGAVPYDANRFSFNLKNAEKDANNYFHFNPRFDEGCVVRNTRFNEAWGDEERDGDNPFEPGKPFLIGITPTVDGYEVEVNGSPFITFAHRDDMNLCDVTHISMGGEVTVYGIHILQLSMPVPLTLRIPQNTFVGDTLIIKGEIPSGADRFAINLQCGAEEGADIMYHFNPRFGDNVLVCNNRCADSWGEEDRLESLPIGPGDNFKLAIVASKEGYQPFINDKPLPLFPHRLDMCEACTIAIDGDVIINDLTIDCPPVRLPPKVPDINMDEFDRRTIQYFYPSNPFIVPLPGDFGPGKMVYLSGKVDDEPTRFKINLQCGENDESGVALHFNPRWDDEQVLVLNSLDDGSWGEEVRAENNMPPGSDVQIHILCNEDGFCILLDGDTVACFPHRISVDRVTHVEVDGSIKVSRIMAI